MIIAKMMVKGDDRDYGTWAFATLPSSGDLIGITVNEAASTFMCQAIIHVPVIIGVETGGGVVAPTVAVVVVPHPSSLPS